MSKYSSNSDDDAYHSKKARRKRHRLVKFLRVSYEKTVSMYNNLLPKFFLDLNHTHPMKVTKEEEMTDGIDGHAVEVEIGLYDYV